MLIVYSLESAIFCLGEKCFGFSGIPAGILLGNSHVGLVASGLSGLSVLIHVILM